MYPKNNASPPVIAVGQVILIADGSVVTADAAARVKIGTGGWGASAGTLACDTTSGCWTYVPSQAETNAESFLVAVYKASCIGCQVTVVTTASATAGKAYVSNVDNDAITAAAIAAGAIDFATFAADCKTGAGLKANVESITANVIDAAAIKAGAIDAATFAADVEAAVAGWVWTALTASYGGVGSYGQMMQNIIDDTGVSGVVVAAASKTGYTLTATTGLGNQTANITGTVSGNSTHSAADVVTALGTGSTLTALATAAALAAAKAILDKFNTMVVLDGAVYDFTAASLAAAPGGTGSDPLDSAVPGAYAAGTAGYVIGTYLDAAISGVGGAVGSGADSVTVTWTSEGDPVADGDVWVASDSGGSTVVAGTLQTNSNGQATFMLDNGAVYWLFGQKDGINSIRGERFVAVAD